MQQGPNQKPLLGADNNALVALLAINLVAYVMLGFLKVIYSCKEKWLLKLQIQ
jgi:hypothetical protein